MSTHPEVRSTQPPSGQLASPENVLSFWFGTPGTNEDEMTRIRRWFRGGAPMDEEVARRFGPAVEAALRHDLDGWAATARGRLALVLLLDQMTRSLYRNDPRSYAGDAQAQALSAEAFKPGLLGVERPCVEEGSPREDRITMSSPLACLEHHCAIQTRQPKREAPEGTDFSGAIQGQAIRDLC
jgi:hypothetical protein